MDRFIVDKPKLRKTACLHLKSNMDRFIEVCTLGDFLGGLDLKSNMDRFID